MSKQAVSYIIEKMRGDSLTPLGNGKDLMSILTYYSTNDEFFTKLSYAGSTVPLEDSVTKAFRTGKPFLKGQWKEQKSIRQVYEAPLFKEDSNFIAQISFLEINWDRVPSFAIMIKLKNVEKEINTKYFNLYHAEADTPSKRNREYVKAKKEALALLLSVTGIEGSF